ncbi:MAG: hypothetical protein WC760_09325 [Bacteroidia bacterium]
MNDSDIQSSASSLARLLNDESIQSFPSREALEQWLTERIIHFLLHDMEKLLHLLYRIDVQEKKVKEAFAQNNPKLIAPMLAKLIMDREEQKIETRKKFR